MPSETKSWERGDVARERAQTPSLRASLPERAVGSFASCRWENTVNAAQTLNCPSTELLRPARVLTARGDLGGGSAWPVLARRLFLSRLSMKQESLLPLYFHVVNLFPTLNHVQCGMFCLKCGD